MGQRDDCKGQDIIRFFAKCREFYPTGVKNGKDAKDLLQLRLARIDIEDIPPVKVTNDLLNRWISFENTLRNELVKIRSKPLQIPEEKCLRPESDFDPSARPLVHQAIDKPSPHKAEIELIKIRWDFLTHYEVGHYFDLTVLIIYGLKLQLLG